MCAALPLEAGEGKAPPAAGKDAESRLDYRCLHVKASEAREVLVKLLGEDKLSIKSDERTNTLHLRGSAALVADAKVVLTKIDAKGEAPIICGPNPILKVYKLPAGSAEALARTLQALYAKTHVRISTVGADRLAVYGFPEDQDAIAPHVRVAGPRVIEVLPLTTLEPARAVEMLRTLFAGSTGPAFLPDAARNAIVVRGFKEQVDEVRSALKALGETGAPAGGMRVITLEQGDAATLAEAIQKMLPQLRNNPVRVIVPGGKPPAPGKPGSGAKGPGTGATRVITLEKGDAAKLAEAIQDALSKARSNPVQIIDPRAKPGPKLPGSGKPITLTAVGNRLLIACDEPEALALVLQLVNLYTAPQQSGPEIIRLRHASAIEAARILDELFNGRAVPNARRAERVRIVADPSSNALLVRASPLDLLTIRRVLAGSLDAGEGADSGTQTYVLGPLRHASAAEVAKVLRDVYRDSKPTPTFSADARTNTVILRGSAAVYQDARKLVERLDVKGDRK
jgi:type II secretory pathway component GspD/PulD (secretin)